MKYYTYVVKHIPTGKLYYGCRYSKKANPDELWVSYFTSSKYVKEMIANTGKDSFIFEVRKTFDCPMKCKSWEAKFLLKVNAAKSELWINKHNGDTKFLKIGPHTQETKDKISKSSYDEKGRHFLQGRKHSQETINKMRKPKPLGFGIKISKKLKCVSKTEEHKQNLSINAKNRWNDEEQRLLQGKRKKGSIPWNKGKTGIQTAWNKGIKCS